MFTQFCQRNGEIAIGALDSRENLGDASSGLRSWGGRHKFGRHE